MSAAISSSRPVGLTWTSTPDVGIEVSEKLPRAEGQVNVGFRRRGENTVLSDLFQSGSGKARFPKIFDGGPPEAVLINLAGGITGGDCFQQRIHFAKGAHAVVTTQAAEKIYKASDNAPPAEVSNRLTAEAEASAEWLPQETIFFSGGRVTRRLDVTLDRTARLLACEPVVFGRTAMKETVHAGFFQDSWRISIGDRLVFADGFHLEGDIQRQLDRIAIAAGGKALATMLYVGPDSEGMIGPAKKATAEFHEAGSRAAASRIGPVIVARFVAADGRLLKSMLIPYIERLRSAAGISGGLPKLWRC